MRRRPPAWLVVVPLAGLYLLLTPQTGDLAAATYRARLFSRAGLAVWDNDWYAGHHLPAYSLLAPPLAAWLGPALLTALSAVLAAWAFSRLAHGWREGRAATAASLWGAVAIAATLPSGRVPFTLGLAVGLCAVLGARRSAMLGGALALIAAVASPVAGAFLALTGVAMAASGERAKGGALALGALVPVAALELAFPEGGTEPFAAGAFWPALALLIVCVMVVPARERALRLGGALYTAAFVAAFAVPSAVGGNVERLGSTLAGPVLALALWGRRPRILAALALPLWYWNVIAPIRDTVAVSGDPSVHRAYYAPLLAHLPRGPVRIEIPFTRAHWEAVWVPPRASLARGWERQLDVRDDPLFYEPGLSSERLRRWLSAEAVAYVALPDAPLDSSSRAEARLLRGGLPYLREVWRGPHWRLFAVQGATPLVSGGATLEALTADSFTLRAPRAGSYLVRIRFTPYWTLDGCVGPGPGGFTLVSVPRAGTWRARAAFSPGRVGAGGRRCTSISTSA